MKEIVVSNGLYPIITQALEEMKSEQGDSFRLEEVNLSELERRTGISRAKLRRLKKDGFKSVSRSKKKRKSILDGYTSIIGPKKCPHTQNGCLSPALTKIYCGRLLHAGLLRWSTVCPVTVKNWNFWATRC